MTSEPIPVVFDTDIGTNVDDALALALALASPEIRLVGVTVCNGDAPTLQLRARIAARLLGLAGRADVPVVRGHPQRLSESDRYTHLGHEGEGLLEFDHDGPEAPIHDTPAADWLTEQSMHQRLHVVATGPLTTIAVAMQRDPQLARRLRHLSVMGGLVDDYNTACDPRAALVCATSGVPITWVTIEVTRRTALTRDALERMRRAGAPLLDALCRLTDIWSERVFRHTQPGPPGAVANYHDPLAMASVFGGPWLTLRDEHLHYAVVDGRFHIRPDIASAHRAQLAVDADSSRFETMFLQRVLAAFGSH
jgi:purine nucleosidase